MSPIRMEKIEFATRTVLAYIDAINHRNAAAMETLLTEKCIWEASGGENVTGRQAIQRHWEEVFQKLPNLQFEVEEAFGIGERSVLRWRSVDGGKPNRGVDIFRVRNGAILEIISYRKE
jgi:predicted ester cyclase